MFNYLLLNLVFVLHLTPVPSSCYVGESCERDGAGCFPIFSETCVYTGNEGHCACKQCYSGTRGNPCVKSGECVSDVDCPPWSDCNVNCTCACQSGHTRGEDGRCESSAGFNPVSIIVPIIAILIGIAAAVFYYFKRGFPNWTRTMFRSGQPVAMTTYPQTMAGGYPLGAYGQPPLVGQVGQVGLVGQVGQVGLVGQMGYQPAVYPAPIAVAGYPGQPVAVVAPPIVQQHIVLH